MLKNQMILNTVAVFEAIRKRWWIAPPSSWRDDGHSKRHRAFQVTKEELKHNNACPVVYLLLKFRYCKVKRPGFREIGRWLHEGGTECCSEFAMVYGMRCSETCTEDSWGGRKSWDRGGAACSLASVPSDSRAVRRNGSWVKQHSYTGSEQYIETRHAMTWHFFTAIRQKRSDQNARCRFIKGLCMRQNEEKCNGYCGRWLYKNTREYHMRREE